jgi:hypothetical protein
MRVLIPGRSRKAELSALTTSRFVARALAAMIRSCAPRGLPPRPHSDEELSACLGYLDAVVHNVES